MPPRNFHRTSLRSDADTKLAQTTALWRHLSRAIIRTQRAHNETEDSHSHLQRYAHPHNHPVPQEKRPNQKNRQEQTRTDTNHMRTPPLARYGSFVAS
ncbi:hypothetical protein Zmor_003181 [Zophobas morio]|uniref:Uncharacterized protein n=1 Tax=Zophobas morio TaxID=2755281 RepID=A0AA38M1B0_9CUCU|nr:hypothetical protein Zmor_003181 [Zophobas morio]